MFSLRIGDGEERNREQTVILRRKAQLMALLYFISGGVFVGIIIVEFNSVIYWQLTLTFFVVNLFAGFSLVDVIHHMPVMDTPGQPSPSPGRFNEFEKMTDLPELPSGYSEDMPICYHCETPLKPMEHHNGWYLCACREQTVITAEVDESLEEASLPQMSANEPKE